MEADILNLDVQDISPLWRHSREIKRCFFGSIHDVSLCENGSESVSSAVKRALTYQTPLPLHPYCIFGRLCVKSSETGVFGIQEFHYYYIANGLTSIFMRYLGRIVRLSPKEIGQGDVVSIHRLKKIGETSELYPDSCLQN